LRQIFRPIFEAIRPCRKPTWAPLRKDIKYEAS
jgi:hypothetical protein